MIPDDIQGCSPTTQPVLPSSLVISPGHHHLFALRINVCEQQQDSGPPSTTHSECLPDLKLFTKGFAAHPRTCGAPQVAASPPPCPGPSCHRRATPRNHVSGSPPPHRLYTPLREARSWGAGSPLLGTPPRTSSAPSRAPTLPAERRFTPCAAVSALSREGRKGGRLRTKPP
ncbi:hypothetical protein U9M48_012983, partial [Paspalum notatum var. saurae]